MDYSKLFNTKLQELKSAGNYREFTNLERYVGNFPHARNHNSGSDITIWCNNDYLGMGQLPAVVDAIAQTAKLSGAGSGGTRNIAGTSHPLVALENELADLHNKQSALVFTSGYMTNSTVISTLAKYLPDAVLFSDANNHASMIEGVRNSKAKRIIFNHNDIDDLENKLKAIDINLPKIIIFESVYSMDGDFGKVQAICQLAKQYNALTYLDEVHAVGIYGYKGGGIAQKLHCEDEVDIIQGTLGKAFGVIGGYIAANTTLIDFIRSFAPGFIFTTAMSPPLAAGALASVQHVKRSADERQILHERVALLKTKLRASGLPIYKNAKSHIIPIMIGDAEKAKKISKILLEDHNIFIQHINHPTVPIDTERLRLTPTPMHDENMMDLLIDGLVDAFDKSNVSRETY